MHLCYVMPYITFPINIDMILTLRRISSFADSCDGSAVADMDWLVRLKSFVFGSGDANWVRLDNDTCFTLILSVRSEARALLFFNKTVPFPLGDRCAAKGKSLSAHGIY